MDLFDNKFEDYKNAKVKGKDVIEPISYKISPISFDNTSYKNRRNQNYN